MKKTKLLLLAGTVLPAFALAAPGVSPASADTLAHRADAPIVLAQRGEEEGGGKRERGEGGGGRERPERAEKQERQQEKQERQQQKQERQQERAAQPERQDRPERAAQPERQQRPERQERQQRSEEPASRNPQPSATEREERQQRQQRSEEPASRNPQPRGDDRPAGRQQDRDGGASSRDGSSGRDSGGSPGDRPALRDRMNAAPDDRQQSREDRQEQRQEQRQERREEKREEKREDAQERREDRQEKREDVREERRDERQQERIEKLRDRNKSLEERVRDDRRDARDDRERQNERIDRLKDERRERRDGDRIIITEPGGRTIIREGGRTIIRRDEGARFRIGVDRRNIREERRGGEIRTVVTRPDGSRVITVTDDDGRLIRRVREVRGQEYVLIDNRPRGGGRPGFFVNLDIAAPRVSIPRERYVVDARNASEDDIEEAFAAPPVERLERSYTLDEVRQSAPLRQYVRSVDLDAVTFDTGSWDVRDDQVTKLEKVGLAMEDQVKKDPKTVFMIEGHTDAVGSDDDNLSLSDRRAEAVAETLTKYFDIPAENLTTQGYGEQYPKVQTDGAEERNRRVTVRNITTLLSSGK